VQKSSIFKSTSSSSNVYWLVTSLFFTINVQSKHPSDNLATT